VCLNKTYSKIWTCKPLLDMFPIKNGLKGDALSSLLFNLALKYDIRKFRANHMLFKFHGTHQVIIYADDVNLRSQSIHDISFISPLWGDWSRSKCWESLKYVSVPWTTYSTKSRYINTCNTSFENVAKFEYLWITPTYQNYAQNEINSNRMHLGNASYHLVQNHPPNSLLPKNVKIKIHTTIALHVVLNGCETWSQKEGGT